jgi:protocatechuate 3,4-dioxygenase beta subunit
MSPERRRWLQLAAYSPLLALPSRLTAAPATPACNPPAAATRAQMAGPFVRDDLPWRNDLRSAGERTPILRLQGQLRDRDCQPLQEAVISLWHADPDGRYDLRGGRYYVPGVYPGRVRHLHVQVASREGRLILTTQLYFPEEPGNARDGLFDPALLMATAPSATGLAARFDIVI